MITTALLSLSLLLYTYAGYPILVALLAAAFPRKPRSTPAYEPTVSACLSVFNAAAFLPAKLDSLLALDYPAEKLEVLVYDDGSTDESADIVRRYAARDPRVKLVRGQDRQGKPTALNTLRELAKGEVLLMNDARQPISPGSLRALVRMLADPKVGCVSGDLILQGAAGAGAYWKYEKWIRRNEARFCSLTGVTGAIYVVRKDDLAELPRDTVCDDMWIPLRLRLSGREILFCEDAQAFDEAFDDDRELGRKVRTLAGNFQIFARMPNLLLPFVNPSWFEVVSHKVLRLACPWALVALLVSSGWASVAPGAGSALLTTGMRALVASQVLFYLLALVGARAGRLPGLCRTFVVLNAAALVAFWRHVRGAQRISW
ncbi:MAG: glycosyltransferase family 2 protein [Deltaproteobacteria bacterium]|nr:glycosyltransferase family 2 protein [Deltaproteobacteria bacterium]